jgi:3-oxoadipate enol-lactonase
VSAVTTSHVDVPGGRLPIVDEGAGPPILLLHAWIADLRAWDPIVPNLTAAGHRVIRYDARGFGASTTDEVAFSHRADAIAVLDALGIGRAALVGNSGGGRVAFDTAVEFPDRVVAVVGVGAGLGGFFGESTAEEQILEAEGERLENADPYDPAALTDFEVRVWVDGPGQRADRVAPAIREAVREMDLPLNQPDRMRGTSIVLQPAANDRLADLRCPVLAVAGALDLSEVAQTALRLAAAAPNARALVWPDVAHMIGMEVPERLAETIVEFLAPLDRWA